MPQDGDVTLLVGGQAISGWQDVRVSRGLELIPSNFDISMTEQFPGQAMVTVEPGQPCVLKIGGDVVVTGVVDRYAPWISKRGGTQLRVSGRGKCRDLVDCSAYLRGSQNQLNAATSRQVVEALCGLFGITVSAPDGDGAVVPQFNVVLTETCWDIIDRVARHSQMTAFEGADGNLILSKVARDKAASGFREGVNVERAGAEFSADQRYSLYEAVFTPTETLGDLSRALGDGQYGQRGRATDETIGADKPGTGRPFRPLVLIAEVGQDGTDIAQQRCDWERARRIGRSQAIRITADSWRDASGKLWQPNTLAPLHIPALKVPDREWLITEVTYVRGKQGTQAEVVMMPREGFLPKPIILQPFDAQVYRALQASPIPPTAPATSGIGGAAP